MQQQKFRFTKTNIQALPFSRGGNDRPEYRDTALPGLVLRVGKTVKTYYLYRYNEHLKRHEKLKLGNHLQLIPDTARLKAMDLLAKGCSAQEVRRQQRSSTIEKLAKVSRGKRQNTSASGESLLASSATALNAGVSSMRLRMK